MKKIVNPTRHDEVSPVHDGTELEPLEVPTEFNLSDEEIASEETEKAEILAAMRLPDKAPMSPKTFAQARLAGSRATGQLDPAVVQQQLNEKTAALQAKEAELAAATDRDRLAAEQREQELHAVRMEVGQAQQEQAVVLRDQVGPAMADRVARYQAASASNMGVEATEDAAYRTKWIAEARPLIAKVEAFLKELYPFADTNLPSLRTLSKMRWEDAPVAWAVQYRVQLAGRAVNPSKELIGDINDAQTAAEQSLARAEQVIAGHAPPSTQILERLVNASRFTVENYRSRLNILDHELKKVETRGEASVKRDFVPTVTISRRVPLGGGAESGAAPIITNWDRRS